MSKSIANGLSQDITVQAGQSIKFAWLGGTYTAKVVAGAANLPVVLTQSAFSDSSFGPFAGPVVIRLTVSPVGRVAWDSGATLAFRGAGQEFTREDDGVTVQLQGVNSGAAYAQSNGGAVVAKLPPMKGFRFPTALIPKVYMTNGRAWTTTSARDYIDPACLTGVGYHVDPINGLDTNSGIGTYDGDFSLALKTVRRAMALGNAAAAAYRIIVPGGATAPVTYDVNSMIGDGGSMAFTQSCVLYAIGNYRAIFSSHSDPVTFTLDQGTTYLASVPLAGATYPIGRLLDMVNLNASGFWSDLNLAASLAACRTTAGSYFIDTGTTPHSVYINRGDGVAPTVGNTRIFLKKGFPGISTTFTGTKAAHFENVEFHGGPSNSGQILFNPGTDTATLSGKNIGFRYSNTGSNSITGQSGKLIIMEDWEGYANATDVFNAHGPINTLLVTISIRGRTRDNGRFAAISNNGYTIHDGVLGIEIDGDHADNYGGNFAHVSTPVNPSFTTQVWAVGGRYGASRGNPLAPTALNDAVWSSSAEFWLDSCTITGSEIGNAIRVDNDQLPAFPGRVLTRDCSIGGRTDVEAGSILSTY